MGKHDEIESFFEGDEELVRQWRKIDQGHRQTVAALEQFLEKHDPRAKRRRTRRRWLLITALAITAILIGLNPESAQEGSPLWWVRENGGWLSWVIAVGHWTAVGLGIATALTLPLWRKVGTKE